MNQLSNEKSPSYDISKRDKNFLRITSKEQCAYADETADPKIEKVRSQAFTEDAAPAINNETKAKSLEGFVRLPKEESTFSNLVFDIQNLVLQKLDYSGLKAMLQISTYWNTTLSGKKSSLLWQRIGESLETSSLNSFKEVREFIFRTKRNAHTSFFLPRFPLDGIAEEIKRLLASDEIRSIKKACTARDILVAWNVLDTKIWNQEIQPSEFKSIKALVHKTNEFNAWFTKNQTTLPYNGATLSHGLSLSFKGYKLTSLPPAIGRLTQLTFLSLENNQLTSLPSEIWQLKQLTCLNLNDNQLTSLPTEIGGLAQLTHLYVKNNQLTSFPAEIGLLNLTQFSFDNNPLKFSQRIAFNLFSPQWASYFG